MADEIPSADTMRRSRFNRLAALAAIVALVFATSAYLAHGYGTQALPHKSAHCDLCLQFNGGSAAAPPASAIVRPVPSIIRLPPHPRAQAFASNRKARAHQPRAPPARPVV